MDVLAPPLSAVPERKLSISGSGRSITFTIRGVREIRTSVRLRSWSPLTKSRPNHGISLTNGTLLLVTDSTSW
jgi:hypothetical protein